MESIGYDLAKWTRDGRLRFHAIRPSLHGLEMHLAMIHKQVEAFRPVAVIMDPITSMTALGESEEIKAMLTRVIDYLKMQGITTVFTSLTSGSATPEESAVGISSLMDTWLAVRMLESQGERNRLLYVLKSRGMGHSNQMREFMLTGRGIELRDVYVGPGTVFTGSARVVQEAYDRAEANVAQRTSALHQRRLSQEKASLASRIRVLSLKLETVQRELEVARLEEKQRLVLSRSDRALLSVARKAD